WVGVISKASVPAVPLIAPIAFLTRQYVGDVHRQQVLGLLVTELRRELQPTPRPMTAIEWPVVHLITEKRLWLPRRFHVQRFVVIVRAGDCYESRARIGAHQIKEVPKACTAEPADRIPSLDADMTPVLWNLRQRPNLIQRVTASAFHGTANGECPPIEIDSRLEHIVPVVWKAFEGHDVGVPKDRRAMTPAKQCGGCTVAPRDTRIEYPLLPCRNGEATEQQQRTQLQQLATRDPRVQRIVHTLTSIEEDSAMAWCSVR